MIFGYARVSSIGQNINRQVKELNAYGCERIYEEKQSGKNFSERPVYHEMKSKMRFGDVLVVHDLSRFGRNKEEIRNEWKTLIDEEIDIVVLNMPILDTRKYKDLPGVGQLVSDLVLTLLSWMVDEERERIRAAQKEGIALAKVQGKYKGTPKMYRPDSPNAQHRNTYKFIVQGLKEKKSIKSIAADQEVSRNTVYRIKKELEDN